MTPLIYQIHELNKDLNKFYHIEEYNKQTMAIINFSIKYNQLKPKIIDSNDELLITLLNKLNDNKNEYLKQRLKSLESKIFQE